MIICKKMVLACCTKELIFGVHGVLHMSCISNPLCSNLSLSSEDTKLRGEELLRTVKFKKTDLCSNSHICSLGFVSQQ